MFYGFDCNVRIIKNDELGAIGKEAVMVNLEVYTNTFSPKGSRRNIKNLGFDSQLILTVPEIYKYK
jgi:predicted double-glycine peptidase